MAVNALRIALAKAQNKKPNLLSGAKELTDDVKKIKIPLSVQLKYQVAQMLDEFIIPELMVNKRGI